GRDGLGEALAERGEWARMRMNPSDLADVSGAAYTYLANGRTPTGNWTGLFRPGERVRLRFINGSAMSTFDVRIPGLQMTVVAADGQNVHPVTVDEFRIATAETFDVLVTPAGADAFTIFAQSLDRTGHARGTLAVAEGLTAPVPEMDRIVYLTMADMGHGAAAGDGVDHSSHSAAPVVAPPATEHAEHAGHGAAAPASEHAAHGGVAAVEHAASEHRNPGVDMQAAAPAPKLADP